MPLVLLSPCEYLDQIALIASLVPRYSPGNEARYSYMGWILMSTSSPIPVLGFVSHVLRKAWEDLACDGATVVILHVMVPLCHCDVT